MVRQERYPKKAERGIFLFPDTQVFNYILMLNCIKGVTQAEKDALRKEKEETLKTIKDKENKLKEQLAEVQQERKNAYKNLNKKRSNLGFSTWENIAHSDDLVLYITLNIISIITLM